jgi:hypothetical protein
MRYYSFYDGPVEVITTLSEVEIHKSYWEYWYGKMCTKFGKDTVDKCYSSEDCLQDWTVVHWAWEVIDD